MPAAGMCWRWRWMPPAGRLGLHPCPAPPRRHAAGQRSAQHFRWRPARPQHPHRRRHRHHADLGHDPAPGSRATRLAAAYAVRSRARAAYLDVLLQRYPDRFSLHVDDEAGGGRSGGIPADRAGGRAAVLLRSGANAGRVRIRDGGQAAVPGPSRTLQGGGDAAGGFTVIAAASGGSHFVAEGSTILDTLLDAGLDIPHSCADGICGTCATRVIEGIRTIATPCSAPKSARRTRKC